MHVGLCIHLGTQCGYPTTWHNVYQDADWIIVTMQGGRTGKALALLAASKRRRQAALVTEKRLKAKTCQLLHGFDKSAGVPRAIGGKGKALKVMLRVATLSDRESRPGPASQALKHSIKLFVECCLMVTATKEVRQRV